MQTIPFITNRNDLCRGTANRFGRDLADSLSAGFAEVLLDPEEAPDIQVFKDQPENICSVEIFDGQCSDPISKLFDHLEPILLEGTDILVFVHGYDTGFGQALAYGAQLQVQMGKRIAALDSIEAAGVHIERRPNDVKVLVVTWPSDGRWTLYSRDRQDAVNSAPVLGPLLERLQDYRDRLLERALSALHLSEANPERLAEALEINAGRLPLPGKIHLLCQSMGALVLASAYVQVRDCLRMTAGQPIFDTVALTGADVGDDAFVDTTELAGFQRFCDVVSVFYNSNDILGLLSRLLKGRKPMSRFGALLPTDATEIDVIDVSDAIEREHDRFGHYYARVNRAVQSDLLLTMCGGDRMIRRTRRRRGDFRYSLLPSSGFGQR